MFDKVVNTPLLQISTIAKQEKSKLFNRSSCSKLFFEIGVRKFRKFHREAPVLNSLLNKVAGLLRCLKDFMKKLKGPHKTFWGTTKGL